MLKLIQWQWNDYQQFHRSKTNLLIHIIAVPSFLVSNVYLLIALTQQAWIPALCSILVMVFSIAVQGRGHKMEETPSIPFSSLFNAIARLLLEQWINFPRFVLSGGWWRALQQVS